MIYEKAATADELKDGEKKKIVLKDKVLLLTRLSGTYYALDNKCLFRYDSPADLAGRMDWWLDHPAERAACGRKYADFARGRFDRSSCMDQMEEMLLRTAWLEGYAP